MMQGVVARGTGKRAQLDRPVAGKTGTTNDMRDAWFLGFTPELITGVWVGYDQDRTLGKGEVGGRAAAPIWRTFMAHTLEGQPVKDFELPSDIILVSVDRSGTRVRPGEQSGSLEAYRRGTEPAYLSDDPVQDAAWQGTSSAGTRPPNASGGAPPVYRSGYSLPSDVRDSAGWRQPSRSATRYGREPDRSRSANDSLPSDLREQAPVYRSYGSARGTPGEPRRSRSPSDSLPSDVREQAPVYRSYGPLSGTSREPARSLQARDSVPTGLRPPAPAYRSRGSLPSDVVPPTRSGRPDGSLPSDLRDAAPRQSPVAPAERAPAPRADERPVSLSQVGGP
jgi:hypothetical protein